MRRGSVLLAVSASAAVAAAAWLALTAYQPEQETGLGPGDFVRVDTDEIRLLATIGGHFIGTVRRDERLLITSRGHAIGSLVWFRVQYFSRHSASPYGLSRFAWLGSTADDQRLVRYEPACPSAQDRYEVGSLAVLTSAELLHCFKDAPLTIGPVIARHETEDFGISGTPEWLAADLVYQLYGDDYSLGAHRRPGGRDLPLETWIEVTGHFSDDAAVTCVRTTQRAELGPVGEDAELWCRQRFVIDRFLEVEEPDPPPPLPELEGAWQQLPKSPLDGREGHSAVWTGTEMVLWGGRRLATHNAQQAEFSWEDGGAAFDPMTREWRVIAPAPIPGREGHAAVWTGTEMLVWGGNGADGLTLAGGGRYDPTTDTWREIPAAPLDDLDRLGVAQVTWTGDHLVAWSGTSVAAYDPRTDAWQTLPPIPVRAPDGIALTEAGDSLVALAYPTGFPTRVQAYLLEDRGEEWLSLPEPPLIALNADRSPIWTGEDILVFSYSDVEGVGDVPPRTFYAARLSIKDRTWTVDLAPQYLLFTPSFWTGNAIYFPLGDGLFEDASRTWMALPPRPWTASEGFSLAWTGGSLIVWGGSVGESFLPLDEGWAFEPR